MKSVYVLGGLTAIAVATTTCGNTSQALGEPTAIIVVATDSLWAAVGDSVTSALEPRIFTVRDERTFLVTHVSPMDSAWLDLRNFRQIIAIGGAADSWVAPVLARAGDDADAAGGLVLARNVWARGQIARAVVVSGDSPAAGVWRVLPVLAQRVDSAFRSYALQRMYLSEPDTVLRDSLARTEGFSLLLPKVYQGVRREGYLMFRTSTTVGGDLIRSVLVASQPGSTLPTAAGLLAWRDSIAGLAYPPGQRVQRDRIEARPLERSGRQVLEVQGIWEGMDPSWPMAGPFILRAYACPDQDRVFLVDSWLFAPSREKYEYMIQLQTLLDTFQCAAGR